MKNPFSQGVQILHHLLFPSHKNNHRARALHLDFLAVYLFFGIMMSATVVLAKQNTYFGRVLGYATDVNVGAVYSIVNDVRTSNGLGRLAINSRLNNAANAKAQNMFAENYWAHTSPSGKTPWSFIRRAGYSYRVAGENLAEGYDTSGAVVNAWMASPSHRANILRSDFSEVGYAVVNGLLQGRETTLVVQMFGTRKTSSNKPSTRGAFSVKGANTDEDLEVISEQEAIELEASDLAYLRGSADLENTDTKAGALINVKSLSRDSVLLVISILLGVLLLDGLVSWKLGLLRLTGNNFAHFVFLGVVLMSLVLGIGGNIL